MNGAMKLYHRCAWIFILLSIGNTCVLINGALTLQFGTAEGSVRVTYCR